MNKFLKIPAVVRVITNEDEEGEVVDGWALIRIDEVQDVIADDSGKSTVYFKSGDSLGTSLSLDELAMILEEPKKKEDIAYCEIISDGKTIRVFASEPYKPLPELAGIECIRHSDHWEIEKESVPRLEENLALNNRRYIKSK